MNIKKLIYNIFPAIPRTNLWIGIWLHSVKIYLNKGVVKKQIIHELKKYPNGLFVNVGCGSCGKHNGWVNLDYYKYESVHFEYDCRKDLPFPTQSVKAIYNEHFFEHLDYNLEVPLFLKDCFRVLLPGGIVRIVVPDAQKYLAAYCDEGWDKMIDTVPLDKNYFDSTMGIQYNTKMEAVNEVFRQSGQHKFAWDFETLDFQLKKAGFNTVYKMEYMKSNLNVLEIDQKVRQNQSLYVEALKL